MSYCKRMPHEPFESEVTQWFNSAPVTVEDLHGRVVRVEFSQMLCPGCVNRSLPQAKRAHRMVKNDQLVVLGFHSFFKHLHVTGPTALEVFPKEFVITFPVAVDHPGRAAFARHGSRGVAGDTAGGGTQGVRNCGLNRDPRPPRVR